MRISGGKARGIVLGVPKGDRLRPAAESVRERLFSSLGGAVAGTSFLDLYAGTGAYGLEALSRGAEHGTFVEKDEQTAVCLHKNLLDVCRSAEREEEDFEILRGDALRTIPRQSGPFDLIFADPPYAILSAIVPKLFAHLLCKGLAGPKSVLVLEMPGEVEISPEGWRLERRLGKPRKGSPIHGLFCPSGR